MIEFASLEHLKMYDRVSKKKGRICYGTFSKKYEPFLGFSDDKSKSETYLKLFERVRKPYLNPVVILKPLPKKYFHSGMFNKRIVDSLHQQTISRMVSRVPDEANSVRASTTPRDKSETEVEPQLPIFKGIQKREEDTGRCSFTVSESVEKVSDEDRKYVRARRSAEYKKLPNTGYSQKCGETLKLDGNVQTRRGRGLRPRRSDIATVKIESKLCNLDNPQKSESKPECLSGNGEIECSGPCAVDSELVQKVPDVLIACNNFYKDDSDSFRVPGGVMDGGTIAMKGTDQAHSPKSNKSHRLHAKHLDKSTNRFISRLLNDDSSEIAVDGSKHFACRETECNGTYMNVIDSAQKVQAEDCTESEVPPQNQELTVGNQETAEDQHITEFVNQLGEIQCNGSFSGISGMIKKIPDVVVRAEQESRVRAQPEEVFSRKVESDKRLDQAPLEVQSLLKDADSTLNSKDSSKRLCQDETGGPIKKVSPPVEDVPNEVNVAKLENDQGSSPSKCDSPLESKVDSQPSKCKSQLGNKVETKPLQSPSKPSDESRMNVESQLLISAHSQNFKKNLENYSSRGEADSNGSLDISSVMKNQEIHKENEEAVQAQHSLNCEMQHERKIEIKLGLTGTGKSGVQIKSQLITFDDSQKCVENILGSSGTVQMDGADVEGIQTQHSMNCTSPFELNVENEKSIQSQYSKKETDHDAEQAVVPQLENLRSRLTRKSDCMEPKGNMKVDIGSSLRLSDGALAQGPQKKMRTLLKPCVVRLKRMPAIEKIVRRSDATRYPIFVKAGKRMSAGLRTRGRSIPLDQQHLTTRKRYGKTSTAANIDDFTRIDLSDGLVLKRFCELKTVSLIDSDSDDENLLSRSLEDRASSPISSHAVDDRASSSILSAKLENSDSSSNRSDVEPDLPNPAKTIAGLDPPADSVVSENPVPSGVQALNELGFLEHEPFQFGKDHPSESVWSDVLDFGEADASGMEGTKAPRGKYCDLLPLPFEDNIPGKEYLLNNRLRCVDIQEPYFESLKPTPPECMGESEFLNSLKSPGKIRSKVSRKLRSKEKMGQERKYKSHLPGISDPSPSNKELFVSGVLMSDEGFEKPRVESSELTQVAGVRTSEFLTRSISPVKSPKHSRKRECKKRTKKERNIKAHDDSCFVVDDGTKGRIGKENETRFHNDSCEMDNDQTGDNLSFPIPKIKPSKTLSKKRKDGHEKFPNSSFEIERASRELNYKLSKKWLTKSLTVENESNDGSVGNNISEEIKPDVREEVPTSEKLYRDLSTIPYILKCNLQNRCRKCRNLYPCANANKMFKLFFTLTVGVGRRLSKPLMETFQNPGDDCKISRTTAYIAASAVGSRPTTMLVPALPEVVQKILPTYHSNLLMQLVAETEELEKKEKKSNSDMAIAETLQLKRALMAMKARYSHPLPVENNDPPHTKQAAQSTQHPQSMPVSESIILQSVKPGNPLPYKTNKIIAMKSKVDNKFRFVRKCLVSILPNKGAHLSEDNERKCDLNADFSEKQLMDSQGVEMPKVSSGSPPEERLKASVEGYGKADVSTTSISELPASSEGITTIDLVSDSMGSRKMIQTSSSGCQANKIHTSSPKKRKASSICKDDHNESTEPVLKTLLMDPLRDGNELKISSGRNSNELMQKIDMSSKKRGASSIHSEDHNESTEPELKKLLVDPSCNGKKCNLVVSNVPGEVVTQKSRGSPKIPLVCVSSNKNESYKPVDNQVAGNSGDVLGSVASPPHLDSSPSSGISSMDSEEPVDSSVENETNLNRAETRNMVIPVNHLAPEPPRGVREMVKRNQCSPSKGLNHLVPSPTGCGQVDPDIEPSGNQLAGAHPFTSIKKNIVCSKLRDSIQTSDNVRDPNVSLLESETPDVILLHEKVESIDLTTGEDDHTNDTISKWGVICTSLPELGFIKVKKISEKLILYDKAIVSDPLEFKSIQELNRFLNTRLGDLTYSYQSKIALEWILVTSGYLDVKTIPPTNPQFWLTPGTARKSLTDMREFSKRHGLPQSNTSTPTIVSTRSVRGSSLLRAVKTNIDQIKPAPRNKSDAMSTSKVVTKLNFDKNGKIVRINGHMVVMGTPATYSKPRKALSNPSRPKKQVLSPQVTSVSSVQPLSGSTTVSAPMNKFLVVTGPSSVQLTSGLQTVQPGLVYTNSSTGYVPFMSNSSSIVQANSLVRSVKSLSVVPNQQNSAPRFLLLPDTIPASSQPTRFMVASSQQVSVKSAVSSAAGVLVTQPLFARQTTPLLSPPISSASRNQTPPVPASKMCHASTIRAPLISSGLRSQTPGSLPALRMGSTTTVRAPYTQIMVAPGCVKYMTLASITPGPAVNHNGVIQTTPTFQSIRKTTVSNNASSKQTTTATVQSSQKTVITSLPLKQTTAAVQFGRQNNSLTSASLKQTTPTVQSSQKTTDPTSVLPNEVSGAALPSTAAPATPATRTATVSSSLEPQVTSAPTACASRALSQKLAEALSQKRSSKGNDISSPPKNRPILILRKNASGKACTVNPLSFVMQKL